MSFLKQNAAALGQRTAGITTIANGYFKRASGSGTIARFPSIQ